MLLIYNIDVTYLKYYKILNMPCLYIDAIKKKLELTIWTMENTMEFFNSDAVFSPIDS